MTSSIEMQLNPYPWYAQMQAANPVVFSPSHDAYLVFGYEEVRQVFRDYQTFSSAVYHGLSEKLADAFENQLQGIDPPRHTKLRALVSHAFTQREIAELEPNFRAIAEQLADEMMKRQDPDFVRDFAVPYPIAVIAEMIGIPEEDLERFKYWSDVIVEISHRLLTGAEELPEHGNIFLEMSSYFEALIVERRRNPKNDLASRLAVAEIEGARLSDFDAANFCLILLVAGNETTTNLLANAVRTFAEHPDQWQLLRSNPSLVPQAIEEVLRFRAPVQLMMRVATQDAVVGGTTIEAGKRVILFMGAANRDPKKFDDPDTFTITRTASPHTSFGHGIHTCLGAPLARLESAIALEVLLQRVEQIRIAPTGDALQPLTAFNLLGLKRLALDFSNG
ncbi:cytochrome P450 [Paenibacillus nanensis]|uniref:Cytochrome P450 n=1 Tax=Paenibacillus nanensis TaxID=393251 RepID=A0A3A1V5H8_9BACL|nr:cytochrome P450 [Paenibacillus nanensis]RIX53883.1 cytochrome P450 [Paenibacillus nanensis]